MRHGPNRRRFLKTALSGATGLMLAPGALTRGFAAAGAGDSRVEALARNLYRFEAGSVNVVMLRTPEGVVLVDGGPLAHADALLDTVEALSGNRRIHTVFNTQWRPEHSGANPALRSAGARIIAHENTRLWMTTRFHVEWEDQDYRPLPEEAHPTDTFYTDGALEVGGEQVEYGYLLQAITDGDIYVHFRDANVLAAGAVVSVGRYPVSDYVTGGWIGGLLDATKRLLDMADEDTRIVPVRGPIVDRAHLEKQHQMLDTVFARMVRMIQEGKSAREMVDEGITAEFDDAWGDPHLFIANGYMGMWGHVREFESGIV